MAGFDDALERLVIDPGFRTQMEQDPQSALADYDLTDDERQLLTSQLSHEAGVSGGVEQRTSKSGLAGALGMLDDAGAAATGDPIPQEHMSLNFGKVEHTGGASETMSAGGSGTGSGSGKANMQDLTLSKYTDPAGDVDQPVIVGSVYNAEDTGEGGDYGYMDDDIPSGAPPPSDGVQDGLSNTVLVSESTDQPDSAGSKKGNVQAEWKVEEGAKADDGGPTDLAGSEPPAEGNKLFVGGLSSGTDDAAPGGGQNEIQFEDTPGTEEADSHGMGSPYLKKACFDNTMDPSGNPDDLVADGNEEIASSPAILQSLTNNEVPTSDDSHEIEMDVHVGRSEPDDALTTGEPSTDTDTPPTLGDVVVVRDLD